MRAAETLVLLSLIRIAPRTASPRLAPKLRAVCVIPVTSLYSALGALLSASVLAVYAQVSLRESPTNAGLYIMYFFLGFVIASLIGGRILDKRGARPAVVLGGAVGAVGFYLLAGKLTDLSLSHQWVYVSIAGAGIGLMITPAEEEERHEHDRHQAQRGCVHGEAAVAERSARAW